MVRKSIREKYGGQVLLLLLDGEDVYLDIDVVGVVLYGEEGVL